MTHLNCTVNWSLKRFKLPGILLRIRESLPVIGRVSERSKTNMSELNGASRGACNSKGSMIVVSNRLPFVLKRNEKTGELERKAR